MGAYVTLATMLTVMPGLPQTTTAVGYIDTASRVNTHINRAESKVNGKLAIRYVTPFTTTSVPPNVRTITEDIATYYIYRSFFSSDSQNYNDYLDSYKEAIDDLIDIRDGKSDLADTQGALIEDRPSTGDIDLYSNTDGEQPFFDIDTATSQDFANSRKDRVKGNRDS